MPRRSSRSHRLRVASPARVRPAPLRRCILPVLPNAGVRPVAIDLHLPLDVSLTLALIIGLAVAFATRIALRRRSDASSAPSARPAATAGDPEADRATLAALRQAGADLTKPTEVNFYLYFPSREVAERAADTARVPELVATVEQAAVRDQWLLLLSGTIVPTEPAIRAASTRLAAVAAHFGGEYDGWEAAVTT